MLPHYPKRTRKVSKSKLRNKADRLLQEYIRTKHNGELCWICGDELVSVGHHFIYKSQANATRYYLPNIIPLGRNCHCLIHAQPSITNAKVCFKMGKEWFDDLVEVKRRGQKFTKEWVEIECKVLEDLLKELPNG